MPLAATTPEERGINLVLARRIRQRGAQIREALRTGRLGPAGVLLASADKTVSIENRAIGKMRVRTLLLALPGVGPATAERVMRELVIHPRRRLGGLSTGQRSRLLEWLRARG